MNAKQLWETLAKSDLVTGEEPQSHDIIIPWYIRVIQGFSGWLAALFIMGFIVIFFGFIFSKPSSDLVITFGILCSIGGYVLIQTLKNDFVEQLGMAFSLCGQILMSIGLFFFSKVELGLGTFILGTYQLILAWIIPQYAHRLLTTAFGLFALLIAINMQGYYGIGSALIAILFGFIWMKEAHWGTLRDKWEPIGFGVALTMVFSSGFLITGKFILSETFRSTTGWLFEHAELISSLLIALLFLNIIILLLKEYKVKFNSKTAILSFIAATGLILISFKIYGLSTGMLLVLIGFARHRTVLVVLGSLSVASFFSWYYYNLHATLLFKSIVLIILGLTMLAAWAALNKLFYKQSGKADPKLKLQSFKLNKLIGVATMIVAIIAINFNIYKKEDLIENGEVLLFKLAPVDPRSLMQGDYMRLRFDLAGKILNELNKSTKLSTIERPSHDGQAIILKNDNNVVSFVALYDNQALTTNQRIIPYKLRNRSVKFTTNAFFFQEGKASHFQKSEYGEFKMSEDGEILLVNMVDKDLKVL